MGFLTDQTGQNSTVSNINFRPDDLNRIFNSQEALKNHNVTANAAATTAANGINTNFGSLDPRLNTNFNPSATLDSYSQGQVSRGLNQIADQTSTRSKAISRSVGPNNPGVANVLGFQNRFAGASAGNGLNLSAMADQRGRESETFQLNNSAKLAQSQQGANLMQLGNQAQQSKAQLGQVGFQNSLAALASQLAAGATKGQNTSMTLSDYAKSKGQQWSPHQGQWVKWG